ncbi:deoxyadenosine kinase [Halalkalibacter akibai JCM 9157]|uniref:Deoxyadenosine kinase n=1 Tax=Halalkalibacter akibai (strain ATCC 43226 / DSM 21942 / CIP 109018 / JCM 9157 / 1139) TaxID=1236973 RepID=W4QQM9_HALA3|nr:deoxyadenosine kinase [Halalkalibacter akibai JCM 9157]
MNNIPFIAVEGPIGVGKTSLAKAISAHYQYHLLKEIVDENPFLSKFYENIEDGVFKQRCSSYVIAINN